MEIRVQKQIVSILFFLLGFIPIILCQDYVVGETYFDQTGFVEYRAGNLPIILSSPHGGNLEPDSIADRDCEGCVYINDAFTRTITIGVYQKIFDKIGCYPHIVINRLHRKKFDANRDIDDAADGNMLIEQAWYGYHAFIDTAKDSIIGQYGRGVFFDIHGHAHVIQRIELGYLLSSTNLMQADSTINSVGLVSKSSIRKLAEDNIKNYSHVELIKGHESFGSLLEGLGYSSVPSITDPHPLSGEAYFSGGYNTARHGSISLNSFIDGIQIELNQEIRFDEEKRAVLIERLADAILEYINIHYMFINSVQPCFITSNLQETSNPHALLIYPNPASQNIIVDCDNNNKRFEILNQLGVVIKTGYINTCSIKISDLTSGIYILRILDNRQNIMQGYFMKSH